MSVRSVDPYEYVMQWVWRHSKAQGVTRYILLRIAHAARWTPAGFETPPLPTSEIARDVGLVDSAVRAHIKALGALDGDLEIVKSHRRGETYRYRLRREQLLPLEDLRPASHRRMAAATPPVNGGDASLVAGGDSAGWRRSHRRLAAVTTPVGGGDMPEVSSLPEEVRTEEVQEVLTSSSAAERFLEWFLGAYREHRGFAWHPTTARDKTIAAIVGLLEDRSVERLQAMAVLMWSDTRDPWLNSTEQPNDRGIHSLRHKAPYLEQLVMAAERPERGDRPPCHYRHTPPCASHVACSDLERQLVAERDRVEMSA